MPEARPLPTQSRSGDDALVLAREPAAGASEAGVDLVGDQQPALAVAERAQRGEEAVRRDAFATAALDRLDQHRADRDARVRARARAHVVGVAEAREDGRVRAVARRRVRGTPRRKVASSAPSARPW